ncbi:hydroxymethylglutaryl-CoA lyase [Emticicia sp. CRIBPO]|uniref:hydroxymethylglutaryl-CoA lyase n=1 Tax=Emticicia sp. CRIBPO TaxID=2683258 RepID=UPI00141300DE|nr:hydroxymethylglutaryl-CoA lyase [Emticicia sp. CRIBPO]NBA88521.1 hydroxymethylglutaryl-CoA lyase [Emticicia sp. CRIBPO]
MLKIIECPRDAIQGLERFVPTQAKIRYINTLLHSGIFDTIDFGSFVSAKVIPQMADTAEVIRGLDLGGTRTKLLAIIANERGAEEAAAFEGITYLGYPFSVSETFQLRNTKATIAESLDRVKFMQELCEKSAKQLVIYISMGFGNPYGDPWSAEVVLEWIDRLKQLGIKIFSLSDTIGVAEPKIITYLLQNLIPVYPDLEIGVHLHTRPGSWESKITAADEAGCRRFDGAILGYGGCPMADDKLVGNMPTENMLQFFNLASHDQIEALKLAFTEMIY